MFGKKKHVIIPKYRVDIDGHPPEFIEATEVLYDGEAGVVEMVRLDMTEAIFNLKYVVAIIRTGE